MRDGEGSFGKAGKVSDMHRRERVAFALYLDRG